MIRRWRVRVCGDDRAVLIFESERYGRVAASLEADDLLGGDANCSAWRPDDPEGFTHYLEALP